MWNVIEKFFLKLRMYLHWRYWLNRRMVLILIEFFELVYSTGFKEPLWREDEHFEGLVELNGKYRFLWSEGYNLWIGSLSKIKASMWLVIIGKIVDFGLVRMYVFPDGYSDSLILIVTEKGDKFFQFYKRFGMKPELIVALHHGIDPFESRNMNLQEKEAAEFYIPKNY